MKGDASGEELTYLDPQKVPYYECYMRGENYTVDNITRLAEWTALWIDADNTLCGALHCSSNIDTEEQVCIPSLCLLSQCIYIRMFVCMYIFI
jgi:hypothetical protein